jgi:hypothetical protein
LKRMLTAGLLAAGMALAASPSLAQESGRHGPAISAPAQLSPSERDAYRAIFASLRAQDWAGAAGRLDGMRDGPLHNLARAMLYTMPGSPRVETQPLLDLLARAPELPQADDLARLARSRGADTVPDLPQAQRSVRAHRPAAPRPAAPDPGRPGRRPARATDPAPDPRRPCGRGRGAARHPQRRALRRGAHRLPELGEDDLADLFIRYHARIGGPADHNALLHLAADLNLPATQFWLAHNAPRGATVNIAARYPRPDWRPSRGWRVDQSLVFAHVLQESSFRRSVVSPAGATGLLQVRPGTAGDIARSRGEPFSPSLLTSPSANMEFGQTYIEGLRDSPATGGLLLKVIAAYNAGPVPVAEWNSRRFDKGDPLLYIESIPYWETRGYLPIVLRNYWIYEAESGRDSGSREALVQGLWPRFPGLPGAKAVRIEDGGRTLAMGTE